MAVDLQFYTEDVLKLDAIDAGQVRMNYGTIYPIKIKNEGMDKARDVIIASSPLNTLDELRAQYLGNETAAQEAYDKQVQASKWKTFSLTKDGDYTDFLSLGNINAQSFLEGEQTINETFTDKDKCMFKDVWSYCLEAMGNNSLKIYKNEAKSQTAQRKSLDIGNKRDVQIMFKMAYERDAAVYNKSNCLVLFPVRIDNKGVGYIFSFQFRASDGKMFFGVYKNGRGMVSNLSRTYGTRIIDTGGFKAFDSNKLMGARIYTDANDDTCFQFMLDGKWQTLTLTSNKSVKGTVVKDPDNTHHKAGETYFDVGMYYGDLSVTLSNFSITTETDQKTIYIKSKIDSTAVDSESYTSAISLSYTEG